MRIGSLVLGAALAACAPYNPDLPATPFLCGDNAPQCPDGFTCMGGGSGGGMICVSDNNQNSNVDGGAPSCTSDKNLEPNDTIGTAFAMPVDTQKKMFDLAGLAICPSGDIDNYSFTISVENENAAATLTYDPAGTPLQMSVLVAGGGSGATPVINGAAVPNMPGVVKASPSNLPMGTYFIQVFGPGTGGTNSYELAIEISGP